MDNKEIDPRALIDKSFDLLGLRGATMTNFSILSAEMLKLLGKKLSPVTLYRIYRPNSESYKPYRYSVALLEDFFESARNSKHYVTNKTNRYFSHKSPKETAFFKLLLQLMFNPNHLEFVFFFKKLTIQDEAMGWERHVVAYALAEYIHSINGDIETDSLLKEIINTPQFRVYYVDTYIDHKYPEKYIKILNSLLSVDYKKNLILDGILNEVFLYAIQAYFPARLVPKNTLIQINSVLNRYSDHDHLESLASKNVLLAGRVVGALLICAYHLKKRSSYRALVNFLFEVAKPIIDSSGNSFEVNFIYGMWMDTLVICNDRSNLIKIIELTSEPLIGHSEEPQILRLSLYRALHRKQFDSFESLVNMDLYFSEGEMPFHKSQIKKAKQILK